MKSNSLEMFRSSSRLLVLCLHQAECFGAVDPDDLNLTSGKREYSNLVAYSGSKRAQVEIIFILLFRDWNLLAISGMKLTVWFSLLQMYFSSVLENRLPVQCGLHAMCVNPGIVATNVVCLLI